MDRWPSGRQGHRGTGQFRYRHLRGQLPPAGGFRITGIKLTVRGSAEGVTAERFAEVAEQAKSTCPVSKALAGAPISLEVVAG